MASAYKTPPSFDSVHKPYNRWVEEIKAWRELTDLDKKKQGIAIALTLPEQDESGIRDKVFSDVKLEDLKKDDGVETLINFMDKLFKKDELSEAYEVFTDFERFKRKSTESMEVYVMDFEKLYNKTKRFNMTLPESVLAFKLLEGSGLEQKDRQLALTGVNYNEAGTLFKQMSSALKKFFGKQSMASCDDSQVNTSIKIEPAFISEEESEVAYMARGNWRRGFGRGNSRRYGHVGDRVPNPKSQKYVPEGKPKRVNPLGPDGYPLKCRSCQSIRHLIRDCPDSYENMNKSSYEKAVLFTGNQATEMQVLASECLYSAVLDSACSSTVAGQQWLQCYLESLSPEELNEVQQSESETVFKFGGGRKLKSTGKWTIPCTLAGVQCSLSTDVVDSDIPLLLSKNAMKKAKVKLDLENDCASIFGKEVELQCTSSGHYSVPLQETEVPLDTALNVMMYSNEETTSSKLKKIEKLHKQFGHPTSQRLRALMKDAGVLDSELIELVEDVTKGCEVCKVYKKTPSRPVVSLPLATEFNEVVAMDLKFWRPGVYFLHLIDMATRFSLATVIRSKEPEVILNKVMIMWIGSGLGAPKKFLADNGGEFANEQFRDMCENLNIEVLNTAAYSPWQNGICERNHAVVDDCVTKILEENPSMKLEVALSWAVNAKNSLQMVYGYSPYQLVFGSNPNLPSVMVDRPPALEGATSSEMFAKHLNGLHAGRRAFIQAESSERIRRALRHQIRSTGGCFQPGQKVYYKRDGSQKWKGPGKVIGQDGKVVFVRHGNIYVRVPSYRIIEAGEDFGTDANARTSISDSHADSHIQDESRGENLQEKQSISDDDDNVKIPPNNENHDLDNPQIEPDSLDDNPGYRQINDYSDDNRPSQNKVLPKVRSNIRYRLKGSDSWIETTIQSRGGKAKGKNWAYLNIQDQGEDFVKGLDFNTDVAEWEPIENRDNDLSNGDTNVAESYQNNSSGDIELAKDVELQNWKSFGVYEEIPDDGQISMSTRWVITNKIVGDKKVVKARLVARGFEEIQEFRADSPTANKETVRMFLSLTSTMGWEAKTIDIKAAFLQGDQIEREVIIKPPREAESPGILWKLKKCVYGLSDASRNWYFSVRKLLKTHGCQQSSSDPGLFFWHDDGQLGGIIIVHVDDFIWSGKPKFEIDIIEKIRSTFLCGKEAEKSFRYIGLDIQHTENGIALHQQTYIDEIKPISIAPSRSVRKNDDLNQDEMSLLRESIGQFNWVATQSRPDISYDVMDLSMSIKNAKIEHLSQANKVLKKLKGENSVILFPRLGKLEDIRLAVFSDASYANLSDGVSSAEGYVILMIGSNGKCCPIAWTSRKIRRVVKSTIAAETLAMVDGLDMTLYLVATLQEVLGYPVNSDSIPINCYIDNKSLYENIYSTKLVSEKRLRIDIASVKQMIERKEIDKVQWVKTSQQISDCLTKRGANCKKLLDIIKQGSLMEVLQN